MIDFLTIFNKGGIVLVWYIQNAGSGVLASVNELIKSFLKESNASGTFCHDAYRMNYLINNQLEVIYVVGFPKQLQLSYMDKFLTCLDLEFRDRYKNNIPFQSIGNLFNSVIEIKLREVEGSENLKPQKKMQTFSESYKSQKTLKIKEAEPTNISKAASKNVIKRGKSDVISADKGPINGTVKTNASEGVTDSPNETQRVLAKLKERGKGKKGSSKQSSKSSPLQKPPIATPKGKQMTKWGDEKVSAAEMSALEYSAKVPSSKLDNLSAEEVAELVQMRNQISSEELPDIDVATCETTNHNEDEANEVAEEGTAVVHKSGGLLGLFSKVFSSGSNGDCGVTEEHLLPVLANMIEHLTKKNVAHHVAEQITNRVAQELKGKQLGTFEKLSTRVRKVLEEVCQSILSASSSDAGSPSKILRDIEINRRASGDRPYVIVFCGVNGVGKSTNLAKVTFWLLEKNFRVLIAACDTFRSGAVEQLRTHVKKLSCIHPPENHNGITMIELYEKGYGKDAAAIATAAIKTAKESNFDVVMIDTAGRMQDNEPLMRSLAKLIQVNQPDRVFFVGEALVGNEAVSQLNKFTKALQDYGEQYLNGKQPRNIDGIVLTKFDAVQDKVGAALSMVYISKKPIIFIGSGQTYAHLCQLSPKAVVRALMK